MTEYDYTESGNALWFILLAIALLTALTMTISKSSDSTEQSGSIERNRVLASEVLRYARSIELAVNQMRGRGISRDDISFEDPANDTAHVNGNCGSDDCKIFAGDGGGIEYIKPRDSWLDFSTYAANSYFQDWHATGANVVEGLGNLAMNNAGNAEFLIWVGFLKDGVCQEINANAGIGRTIPVNTGDFASTVWTGSFSAGGTIQDGGTAIEERKTLCFEDSGTGAFPGANIFYHVVYKRPERDY